MQSMPSANSLQRQRPHTALKGPHSLLVLQLRAHGLHLQLNLPLAVVFQDVSVGLLHRGAPLIVAVAVRRRRAPQVELVGLHIAGGAGAAHRQQANACGAGKGVAEGGK